MTALQRHWEKHPRVEWLKAAQMKYRPPTRRTAQSDKSAVAALMSQLGLRVGHTVTATATQMVRLGS